MGAHTEGIDKSLAAMGRRSAAVYRESEHLPGQLGGKRCGARRSWRAA